MIHDSNMKLRKIDEVRKGGLDWFVRHADFENPEAFIRTHPEYYAQECAFYFRDMGLKRAAEDLPAFIRSVLDNWERGNVAAVYLTPTMALSFRETMNRIAAILENLPRAEVSDDDIIVLYQQGKKLDDIAQAVGLKRSAVHARLKKHGLTKAGRRIEWTERMQANLNQMRSERIPMATIAKRLKVSRSAIYAELARLEQR